MILVLVLVGVRAWRFYGPAGCRCSASRAVRSVRGCAERGQSGVGGSDLSTQGQAGSMCRTRRRPVRMRRPATARMRSRSRFGSEQAVGPGRATRAHQGGGAAHRAYTACRRRTVITSIIGSKTTGVEVDATLLSALAAFVQQGYHDRLGTQRHEILGRL
jgi:hypothetical protein